MKNKWRHGPSPNNNNWVFRQNVVLVATPAYADDETPGGRSPQRVWAGRDWQTTLTPVGREVYRLLTEVGYEFQRGWCIDWGDDDHECGFFVLPGPQTVWWVRVGVPTAEMRIYLHDGSGDGRGKLPADLVV